MVTVWLEGGQGEVRGAWAPFPPPNTPNRCTWTPPPELNLPEPPPPPAKPLLDPPPNCPSLNPPPKGPPANS